MNFPALLRTYSLGFIVSQCFTCFGGSSNTFWRRGADDLIKIEEEQLATKINLSNSYDVQTLLKFIDLVSELFDNTMPERVSISRVNPSVMNRRSIVSAASDLKLQQSRGSLSSTDPADLDPETDPDANRGSIVSNVSNVSNVESSGAWSDLVGSGRIANFAFDRSLFLLASVLAPIFSWQSLQSTQVQTRKHMKHNQRHRHWSQKRAGRSLWPLDSLAFK